jgi:hypothetical protein
LAQTICIKFGLVYLICFIQRADDVSEMLTKYILS